MRKLLALLTLFLTFSIVAAAQTSWQREEKTDPLRGTSYSQFMLVGKFVTAPKTKGIDNPAIIVRCVSGKGNHGHTNGKFLNGYILVGTVMNSEVSGGGDSFIPVEFRLDDGKLQADQWGRSTDFSAVFLSHPNCALCGSGYDAFANLLYGHHSYHKENSSSQIKKVVIGLPEFLGGEVVMQFDLPDANEVAEVCGIVWHK
jgi:hypothetical protein